MALKSHYRIPEPLEGEPNIIMKTNIAASVRARSTSPAFPCGRMAGRQINIPAKSKSYKPSHYFPIPGVRYPFLKCSETLEQQKEARSAANCHTRTVCFHKRRVWQLLSRRTTFKSVTTATDCETCFQDGACVKFENPAKRNRINFPCWR